MQKKHRINPTMTEGSLAKNMLLFSLPLMASNVLQVLFNMSDIAVVGQFAGSHALGSVGSTAILVSLFTGILIGFGSGINIIVARFLGARKDRDVTESVHTAFLLSAIVGLVTLAAGFFGARPLLTLLGTKDILIEGAIRYLQIYSFGLPAAALYNFGNAVFSAAGDTRKPLYILVAAGILNVVLNLFFVIVCHLAEAGVALASAISQWLSAGLVLFFLHRVHDSYRLNLRGVRFHASKVRLILPLGLSAAAQNAIFATANLFIQSGVNTFDAVIVEGTAAAANADSLVYDVMAAIHTACSSFMSQNYGAGKRKRMLHSYFVAWGIRVGIGLTSVCCSCCLGADFWHFRDGCRRDRGGLGALAADGLLLRLQRVHGLHDCGLPRFGQEYYPNDHCSSGLLCFPRSVGLHDLCLLQHDHVPLPRLHLLMDAHRHRRDHLLRPHLPSHCQTIGRVRGTPGEILGERRLSERSASPPDPLSRRAAGV